MLFALVSSFALLAGGFLAAFRLLSMANPLAAVPAALGALIAAALLASLVVRLRKNALGTGPFFVDVAYFFSGTFCMLAAISLIGGFVKMAGGKMILMPLFGAHGASAALFGALCLPLAAYMFWRIQARL